MTAQECLEYTLSLQARFGPDYTFADAAVYWTPFTSILRMEFFNTLAEVLAIKSQWQTVGAWMPGCASRSA